MEKLKSRKFWICVAAALGSLGTGISGLVQGNEKLALAGGILLVVSSSIYAFCEAWVDAKAAESPVIVTDLEEEIE
jgi:hypothetical protein